MNGQVDFLLKIHVGSLNDYHDFVKCELSPIENISVLNSTFVPKEIKRNIGYHMQYCVGKVAGIQSIH